MTEILVPCINSLVILDSDGARVIAKYYDGRSKLDQDKFEISLHKKSKAAQQLGSRDAEVLLIEHELIAFKVGNDCKIFISGSVDENDLILVGVLDCLFDSILTLVKTIDARTLLDCMELVLLAIDEIIDNGNIMEIESSAVIGRVQMRSNDPNPATGVPASAGSAAQQPASLGDLTISQAFGLAKDQFFRSLVSGRSNDGY